MMRYRLLDLLRCIECGGTLACVPHKKSTRVHLDGFPLKTTNQLICKHICGFNLFETDNVNASPHSKCQACYRIEIEEGFLTCQDCGRRYPITAGIPRMLPSAFDTTLREEQSPDPEDSEPLLARKRTQQSFGFEWTAFGDMRQEWEENFWIYLRPLEPEFFRGKIGLDAGCGMGRHLYHATRLDAEMVGLDVSDAVESAYRNTQAFPMAHVVQGDIYHLPFHPSSFDFVYSLGVLHHLPDPEQGFRSLLQMVKPDSTVVVYVYKDFREESLLKYALLQAISQVREITTRMPHRVLYWLCFFGAPLVYLLFVAPSRFLAKFTPTQRLSTRLPFRAYSRYPVRVLHNDLFDRFSAPIENRYTKQEITAWFKRAGLEITYVADRGGWVVFGKTR